MYDVTSRRSFESLDMWLREANKFGGDNLTVFVVANKTDIGGLKQAVNRHEGE